MDVPPTAGGGEGTRARALGIGFPALVTSSSSSSPSLASSRTPSASALPTRRAPPPPPATPDAAADATLSDGVATLHPGACLLRMLMPSSAIAARSAPSSPGSATSRSSLKDAFRLCAGLRRSESPVSDVSEPIGLDPALFMIHANAPAETRTVRPRRGEEWPAAWRAAVKT